MAQSCMCQLGVFDANASNFKLCILLVVRSNWPLHRLPTVLSANCPTVCMHFELNRVLLYETVYHLISQLCILLIGSQFGGHINFQLCFPSVIQLWILLVVVLDRFLLYKKIHYFDDFIVYTAKWRSLVPTCPSFDVAAIMYICQLEVFSACCKVPNCTQVAVWSMFFSKSPFI